MIHKVQILNKIDFNISILHEFEKVIDTEQEAAEFGKECVGLIHSFTMAFGEEGSERE